MMKSLRRWLGRIVMRVSPWYDEKEADERARNTERVVDKNKSVLNESRSLLLNSYENSGRLIAEDRMKWRLR